MRYLNRLLTDQLIAEYVFVVLVGDAY